MHDTLILIENAYGYAGTEKACDFLSSVLGDVNNVDILSFNGVGDSFYPYKKVRKIININGVKNKYMHSVKLINRGGYKNIFIISMGKVSVFFSLFYFLFVRENIKDNVKVFSCEHVSIQSFPKYIQLLKKITSEIYDAVVVLTDRDKQIYESWGRKVVTIANPVRTVNFTRNLINKKILAVGRLSKQKGFDRLLDIWVIFSKNNPDWKLIIAGDGEEKEKLINKMVNLKLNESVTFLGKVNDTDALYKSCDILLMTSHYEGLPMVLLEAQAWGLPAVVYDCPTGPREIIKNRHNGYLVSDGMETQFVECMNEICNDEDLYFSMVKNIKETNPNFQEDVIYNKWKSLITSQN